MNSVDNTKSTSLNIVIIGAGKVGQSLKQLFDLNQHKATLIGREIENYRDTISEANLILITTTDSAIKEVCKRISPYLNKSSVVSHCSGALNSSILKTAKERGCAIASSHPLNTFPSLSAALNTFANTDHNTYLYCEGDKAALERINRAFKPSGFHIVTIASDAKTAYHTACVFACNYLTVLMDLSLKTAERNGIDTTQFWQAIQPLVQATLTNISEHGTTDALSGPIARGDSETITQHLDFLSKEDQSTNDAYLLLAKRALQLANQQGKLSDDKLSQLHTIMNNK